MYVRLSIRKFKSKGKCKCEKSFSYRNPSKKIKDSWGQCVRDKSKRSSPTKRLSEKDLTEKGFVFPEGYNESYKQRVIMTVTYNPTMSKEDFEKQYNKLKNLLKDLFKKDVQKTIKFYKQ